MPLRKQIGEIAHTAKLTEDALRSVAVKRVSLRSLAETIVECRDLLNQITELLVGEVKLAQPMPVISNTDYLNLDELSRVAFKKFSESPSHRLTAAQGYEQLVEVFAAAHDQAAYGKGKERHANGLPFHEQRMQGISDLVGSPDGMLYQLVKKTTEGLQFDSPEKREHELLGALNYLAGIVIWLRRHEAAKPVEG